jgi:outer membrane cobalamin receptor
MPAPARSTDEIVVTGTRLTLGPDALPVHATVIDREAIGALADATLPDLLRGLAGVQLVQPGAGGVTQLIVRGSEPNFAVILVDGVRVNDLNNTRGGSFDLAALNLADVERVEVVRGPQSSIYGSDGLAGVLNVITRAPRQAGSLQGEAEAGGDDYARLSAQVGGAGATLRATHRDDGEAVTGSRYEADSLSARWDWRAGSRWSGGLFGYFADTAGESFPEQSGGPEFAALRELETRSARDLSVGARLDLALGADLALQGTASRYTRRDQYDSPGILPFDQVPPNGARNRLERDSVALRLRAGSPGSWQGTVGVDFLREHGESDGYVTFVGATRYDLARDILGAFAEGMLPLGGIVELHGSVRHDDPEWVGGETTGRLGLLARLAGGRTELRLNHGTGFKLPSFFAVGNPLVGNPDLRPEQGRSWELGWRQLIGAGAVDSPRGDLGLTLFHNAYRDLIDFDPDTFSNVNRDRVTTRGLEAEVNWQPAAALAARAHLTYTDVEVRGVERELLQRPEWRGGAGWRWAPRTGWLLDLDWLYVGDVLDNALPTGERRLDDYHRVDLSLRWQATAALGFVLAVDNLLDARYEEALGFPAAGIRPRLAVNYAWGE